MCRPWFLSEKKMLPRASTKTSSDRVTKVFGSSPRRSIGSSGQIPGDLARQIGVADVVDPQPCVEPRHEHHVVVGEQLGALGMMLIVWAEAPTTRAEVRIRRARRRLRYRQQRHEARVLLIADVDDAGEVVRLLLPFRDRFGVDEQQVSRWNRDHGVHRDHAGERGADVQSGDELGRSMSEMSRMTTPAAP